MKCRLIKTPLVPKQKMIKLTKKVAAYRNAPFSVQILLIEGDYRCDNCMFFNKSNRCFIVKGLIKKSAWCILWVGLPKLTLITLLKK